MWNWRALVLLALAAACSSDGAGPDNAPDVPVNLLSTSLDGAVALTWDDNAFIADPDNFESYRIYSTSYDLDAPAGTERCGTSWRLEGTTVAPEFVVGAMVNGVPRCFSVSSVARSGAESGRSERQFDTPRPDSRNQVLYPIQVMPDSSGFRFWDDDGDNIVEDGELGRVRPGDQSDVDFYVDRDNNGNLWLTPARVGTGVEFYSDDPVADLTSIDDACLPAADPSQCATFSSAPIEVFPGMGYVFEMTTTGDEFYRYGAVRVTHAGTSFLILDWAFQTDPGNTELLVGRK